jgi:hypothetical protein
MKVLILAPHADDAEIGCGGTISRLIREGHEVYELVFSIAQRDIPENFDANIRRKELKASCDLMGIENLNIFEYEDNEIIHRNFGDYRQDILDWIIAHKNVVKPDMAFIPCADDRHQDHQVIHAEGVRGLNGVKTILGCDTPWNHMINANYFVELSKVDVSNKISSLTCYESIINKRYSKAEVIWAWAKFRGLQAGSEYAEVFELIRGGM